MTVSQPTKGDTLAKWFQSSDAVLRHAMGGSSASSTGQATSRTCANRETLVQGFLSKMLPVAAQTIHGAIFLDSYGHESGDVDVAVIAPWGAPVWPYHAHPLIPVEGVIAGVFCEAEPLAPGGVIWRQVSRARSLFKRLYDEEPARPVPRAFTPNLGIWCWGDAPDAARLAALINNARKPEVDVELERRAEEHYSQLAAQAGPTGIMTNIDLGSARERYVQRALGPGAHTPNWFYWHGSTPEKAGFAVRVHRDPNADPSALVVGFPPSKPEPHQGWNTLNLLPGFDEKDLSETTVWSSKQSEFEWKYLIISGEKDARALRALIAYLSTQVVIYGRIVPHYGAYANR